MGKLNRLELFAAAFFVISIFWLLVTTLRPYLNYKNADNEEDKNKNLKAVKIFGIIGLVLFLIGVCLLIINKYKSRY
jgi:hypothetical protein